MDIRDAREDDASAIAELSTGDIDPHHLLRERVVRVATGAFEFGSNPEKDGGVVGFLAFDPQPDAVHVTRVGGDSDVVGTLLEDVIEFAETAELPVKAVVPRSGTAAVALETEGFETVGRGPRFGGRETTRFQLLHE